jgi:hypothetical protein
VAERRLSPAAAQLMFCLREAAKDVVADVAPVLEPVRPTRKRR